MTTTQYLNLLERTSKVAQIGSWEVDLVKNKIFWSDVTKQIHEVPTDFEIDFEKAVSFFTDPLSKETILRVFQNAVENHVEYDEKIILTTATGKEKWVRSIGIPIVENGKCVKVYGLFQDIDKETRKHKAYIEHLSRFQEIFKNTFVGLALTDTMGNFVKVNPSFCNILEYTEEEFCKLSFQDITHPDALEKSQKHFKELQAGASHIISEKRYITKSKKTIWAQIFVSPSYDQDGNTINYIAQIINIDKRKKAENSALELKNITEDQNKRLLNFAHIVSHNLRSHSGNIDMLLEIVKESIPDFANNEAGRYLTVASKNLAETIEHLNEVVAVQTQSNAPKKILNLSEYLRNTLKVLAGSIIDTKSIIYNKVNEAITVNFTPAYLESILLNIVSNAIKYRSKDRIPEITIIDKETVEYIILTIQDNGQGIDLERHGSKLFGMYKTFHEHKDARGIGLFITKNQIESMQGKIEVESTVGIGTTFHIYFKK